MKQNDTNVFYASLLILFVALGCGSSNQRSDETVAESQTSEQPVQQTQSFVISNQENIQQAGVEIAEGEVYIQLVSKELFGVKTKADKRKYYDGSDAMHYAVKYTEDGFKLRDRDEQLLWKVKFGDTGIKLSNTEEMNDAYKIGSSEKGKIKVKQNDEEVASLRYKVGSNMVSILDNYLLNGFDDSLAMGLLLIEQIPEEQKFILCAEIMNQDE